MHTANFTLHTADWTLYNAHCTFDQRLGSNIVFKRIWVLGKTVNRLWVCILQKLFEKFKSTIEKQTNSSVFFANVSQCHISS